MAPPTYPPRLRSPNGTTVILDSRLAVLALASRIDSKALVRLLEQSGLVLETFPTAPSRKRKTATPPTPRVNHGPRRLWVRSVDGRRFGAELNNKIRAVFGRRLEWIGPVYRPSGKRAGPEEAFCLFPDVLLISFEVKAASAAVRRARQFLRTTSAREVKKKSRHLGLWQYWQISDPDRISSMTLRQRLFDRFAGTIDRVELESMPLVRPIQFVPNDPKFSSQWNMTAISAPQAWDTTTGTADVVVAILDTGCDLGHPDLAFASAGVNLGTMSGDGSPPHNVIADVVFERDDGHGTCCAGIACAIVQNSEGVAGVAGSCRILPLAFHNGTTAELAAGLDFAIGAGAKVVSMSVGWDTDPPGGVAVVDDAIERAHAAGLVLVAAAGNANKPKVIYPARHPRILACIAAGKNDDRKRPGTDGENWGSSFGDQVSVAAPGVKIVTTDIRGVEGFTHIGDANYFTTFNGTSAATPHVAGLAALVFSAFDALAPSYQQRNAPLSNDEVRAIIERSADKTGELAYSDRSDKVNGTWNEQMGYGRINAERAIAGVQKRVTGSGHYRTVSPAWLAMMEIRRI
jgi:Subtilase family